MVFAGAVSRRCCAQCQHYKHIVYNWWEYTSSYRTKLRTRNITPYQKHQMITPLENFFIIFFRLSQPPQSTAMSTRYLSTIAFLTRRMTGTSTAPLAQHTQMVRNDLILNTYFLLTIPRKKRGTPVFKRGWGEGVPRLPFVFFVGHLATNAVLA